MATETAALIGASVRRVEDARILTGRGRYVGDVALPGMLHAAFLRSPYPHARIVGLDASEARLIPGVVAVLGADELAAVVEPLRFDAEIAGFRAVEFAVLASDKVRFVGDPVAVVVAESRYVAEDALATLEVEYEPLAAIASVEQALAAGAPAVFDELGDNVVYHDTFSYGEEIEGVFGRADRIVRETFSQQRQVNVPMETRGGVASYDVGSGELTFYASTQAPHSFRVLVAGLIGQPVERMRVLVADVGGSFGLKWLACREDVVICAASKLLGRPVMWIEDRNENLVASGHAREETLDVEAAVSDDGTLLGLKVRMVLDQGAYPIPVASPGYTSIVRALLPGPYRVAAYSFDATVICTNKASYVPLRGPWVAETWVRERLLDLIARELALDRVELRLRNIVGTDEQPRPMITGPTLYGVTAKETLERAVDLAGYGSFRETQLAARKQGRFVGLGIATCIEPAPGPKDFFPAAGVYLGKESALVRVEPNGHLTVFTAQAPHGQSHETTLAQVAAQELGVPFEHVRVVSGDTRSTPFSLVGTGGSRAATMASGAVLYATRKAKEQVLAIASHLLEASTEDLEVVDGMVSVRGAPASSIPLARIALTAYANPERLPPGIGPGLEASYAFDDIVGGWSQATHCCWVEIDVETGKVDITRYLVVEDCGTLINPAVVNGQIRGGVAQGIGGVLYEHAVYGDDGQYLSGTFMDYLVPTAMEVPAIEIHHLESEPIDEVNFRGVAEGGAILAPAAVSNAIEDALAPFGARITALPLTPTRVLELAGVLH